MLAFVVSIECGVTALNDDVQGMWESDSAVIYHIENCNFVEVIEGDGGGCRCREWLKYQ